MNRTSRPSEAGSVILFIFLAIGLFAALSYAVSNMTRSGSGNNLNRELYRLRATEIVDYGRSLRTAAQKMAIDGVVDTRVSFDTSQLTGYVNASCSADICKMFTVDGGGARYAKATSSALSPLRASETDYGDWYFTGNAIADGSGTTAPDLVTVLSWVQKEVCVEINKILGVSLVDDLPPRLDGDMDYAGTKFTGSYGSMPLTIQSGALLTGVRAACVEGNGNPDTGTYHFYQVIVAR